MISSKQLKDAIERNKELMEALTARKGEHKAFIIRKAAVIAVTVNAATGELNDRS